MLCGRDNSQEVVNKNEEKIRKQFTKRFFFHFNLCASGWQLVKEIVNVFQVD